MSMVGRTGVAVGLIAVALLAAGCFSVVKEGFKAGRNLMSKSYLRVSLDGQKGSKDMFKKVASGEMQWKLEEPACTTPTLRFWYADSDRFTRVTRTSFTIYKKIGDEYSDQPEFTIAPRDNNPESLLRPDVDYRLDQLPPGLKILDLRDNEVDRITLISGEAYMFTLAIKADHSETAVVRFSVQ